jgi:hypothetical protein
MRSETRPHEAYPGLRGCISDLTGTKVHATQEKALATEKLSVAGRTV